MWDLMLEVYYNLGLYGDEDGELEARWQSGSRMRGRKGGSRKGKGKGKGKKGKGKTGKTVS